MGRISEVTSQCLRNLQNPATCVCHDILILNFFASFFRCHERAKRLETQFESVAGSDAGAVAKNGQKAEQFFPVTLGKRPTSLSGTKLATIPTQEFGSGKANYSNYSCENCCHKLVLFIF